MKPATLILMLLILAGCGPARTGLRLAQVEAQVCRHCNCYMPARIPEEAPCTVCDCGYLAGQCVRGK